MIVKLFLYILRCTAVVIVVYAGLAYQSCDDPGDYKPRPDSLVYPPNEVPELITPPNDTHFVFGQQGHGWDTIWVPFQWTKVTDVQYYELEIAPNANFDGSDVYTTDAESYTLPMEAIDHAYWHVRAGSDYWKWYTGWSETRHFRVVYPPFE